MVVSIGRVVNDVVDRKVGMRHWNGYMKEKYGNRFKPVMSEDKIWNLKCKKIMGGFDGNGYTPIVGLYSLREGLLYFDTFGGTIRSDTAWLRKFKKAGLWHEISQRGDDGMVLVFKEEDFEKIVPIVQIQGRRKGYNEKK